MEFCGIVVVSLLLSFAVVGLVCYMADRRFMTISIMLLLVLSGVLIAIMAMLLQACVRTNKLMEAAEATPGTSSTFGDLEKKVMLLHVIERRASSSNDRQHLFGIPVTENLRNGWILSLVLAFGTSLWKVIGRHVSQLDVAETVAMEVRHGQLAKWLG